MKAFYMKKDFKKATLEIKLVFASAQISTIISTPNTALSILSKTVEAKQIGNILF